MEKNYTSVTFMAKVAPIKELNPEFTLVKVFVQGVGKNRNGSYMSKENIEKYLSTLNYCPVVGHIREYEDEDGVTHRYMGSHDAEIDWEKWELRDLTVPYGVVVADSYGFEIINEYGTDVEYLTANAILWTGRYEELKECIYSDDILFNQSMEININQYRPLEEDSNYTELLEWNYSALCLLGKADENSTNGHTDKSEHSEPCFISSKVIPLEFAKSEFAEAMSEMKEKLSFCFKNQSSDMGVDIDKMLGGNPMEEKTKDFESEVEEVVEETVEEVPTEEPVEEEPIETETEETTTEDEPTEEDANEPVDFSVEDYNNLKTTYEQLKAEFAEYKESHTYENSECEELKAFKEKKEAEEREASEKAIFKKFEKSIGNTEEFVELKKKADQFSIDELKKECLCIVGLYATVDEEDTPTTDSTSETIKFSVESKEDTINEPYGGIMERYLKK